MIYRWADPKKLQQDHDIALRLIKQQGVIFASDPVAKAQFREILIKVFEAIPDVVFNSILSVMYIYDMRAQPPYCE